MNLRRSPAPLAAAPVCCCLLLFFTETALPAAALSDYLSADDAAELIAAAETADTAGAAAGGKTNNFYGNAELSLVPRYAPLVNRLREHAGFDFNLAAESLRLYKKPAAAGAAAQTGGWSAAERLRLYNGILAAHSLTGLEYYSRRRGKMRTLYEKSEIVAWPDAKKALPDPLYSEPQPQVSVYVRQKDTTFGDNVYQYTYYADEASFMILQQNSTPISFGLVPVIGENKLRSCVAVLDAGPYLLVYMVTLTHTAVFPAIKQQISASINNRAQALFTWFCKQADAAFRQ